MKKANSNPRRKGRRHRVTESGEVQEVSTDVVDLGRDRNKAVFRGESDPSLPVIGVTTRHGPHHSLDQEILNLEE